MNANGILIGSSTAASTGGAAGSATGKGAAGGFAGALVQAMDGSGGNGGSASGTGVTAGNIPLFGLLGVVSAESAELMNLLAGLAKQLEGIDPGAELPAELQEQLAALLLMVQQLLQQPGLDLAESGEQSLISTQATASQLQVGDLPAAKNEPNLVQTLQQSLQQLVSRLNQGETLTAQAIVLNMPLKQALTALQQWNAAQPSVDAQADDAKANTVQTAANSQPAGTDKAAANADASQTAPNVQTEVRKTAVFLRDPAWQHLATAASTASAADQAAISSPPAETPEPSGSTPVWTLLKADGAPIPAPGTSNAAATVYVPIQDFAEQMDKFLVKQFLLSHGNGTAEAKISLRPEHLGQVDIRIMIQNGLLTAQFVTENGAARELLENQMSQLRTALQGQGLQVDKMEVVQESSSASSASLFQHNQSQSGSGQQGGGSNGRGSRGGYDDSAAFEAELNRTAFLREIGFGSSINVTA